MKIKALKRGVGQPRKYKPDKCPHCGSHWHTGNGRGREKCNDCKRTWAIAANETPKILAAQAVPETTETAIADVEPADRGLAA